MTDQRPMCAGPAPPATAHPYTPGSDCPECGPGPIEGLMADGITGREAQDRRDHADYGDEA